MFTEISGTVKGTCHILSARLRERVRTAVKEDAMNITIAAEKTSIATLLSEHVRRRVGADDIKVSENPEETGSFFVGFGLERYVISPSGEVHADRLDLEA